MDRSSGRRCDTLAIGECRTLGAGHTPGSPHLVAFSDAADSGGGIQRAEALLKALSGLEFDVLWREADADSVGLGRDELAMVLLTLGVKYNYALPPETLATPPQVAAFWRSLQLTDLALAHACALGREPAWQQFITRYRDAMIEAATAITSSAAQGRELADSLYADLFGLTERGELRRVSPLAYYSGRGSLKGFLRATLAQRNVDQPSPDQIAETYLPSEERPATASVVPTPTTGYAVAAWPRLSEATMVV